MYCLSGGQSYSVYVCSIGVGGYTINRYFPLLIAKRITVLSRDNSVFPYIVCHKDRVTVQCLCV